MTEENKKMTTYLIKFKNGTEQKVTVPENWKVTFGPAARGNRQGVGSDRYQMPLALRFYESDKKQRAIFTDVMSFRDMSIKIEEKITKTQEKDGYMECDGVKKRTVFQAKVSEWIDPDLEGKPFPRLPQDTDVFDVGKKEQF